MSLRELLRISFGALLVVLVSSYGAYRVALGQSRQAVNLSAAAVPVRESLAQDASSQAEADLQTGISLTRSGRFAEAVTHFLAARGRVREEYAAEFNLALCYVGMNESQKAISILVGLRDQDHESADVESLLSQAYAGSDEPKKAFEAFQKAAGLTPKDEKLYLLVAAAFLEREEYRQGLRVVESGMRNLPDSARLHYEAGYALWQLDESGLAKQEFERATSLNPHSEIGYLAAAQESVMLRNLPQAIQIARTGIREGFADYQLLALLGDALLRDGTSPGQPTFSEARDALEKSVAARPNYASSQIALGRLLLQAGKIDPAIEHLELGRQLAPQNPTPYMLLAMAYRKRGQLEQARTMLDMVAKINEEQAEKRRAAADQER